MSKETGNWRNRAACKDEDPELFFPQSVKTEPGRIHQEEAKKVCQGCIVIDECLTWSLENRIEDGVWGGLGEDERRARLRRNMRDLARNAMNQAS